ncbi:T9SS type B sorting domain-containing protein [Ilyomonas limi]|uniref:T9SS type B sorting domain-containing protein n=1 Tax=Ilyomonas limi TaxID=2575867 RepID=UPI0014853B11|nr:T9SS type B sorting domain-containing protein [Ilyomonas limi]
MKPLKFPCNTTPFSIALYKDTVYGNAYDPETSQEVIFKSVLGNNAYCEKINIPVDANNLTVDSAGVLYWVGTYNNLYSYNPHSAVLNNHGYIPFNSAGDLMFYKGQLYLAADYGALVAVDIPHPGNSEVYMNTGHAFYGLVNIPVGCNQNGVFGIDDNSLVEIDMEHKTVGEVYCSVPFTVYDAASITETGIVEGVSVSSIAVHPDCDINGNSGKITINALSASPGTIDIFMNGKPTDNTGIFKNLAAGSYNFHLVSREGCTIDTLVKLQKSTPINLLIKTLPDTCSAAIGSIAINPAADYGTLIYYLNDIAKTSNFYDSLKGGIYKVSVEDSNNCRIDSNIAIKNVVSPSPITSIEITTATCKKGSGEINVHANDASLLQYSLNNAAMQSSGLFSGLDTGVYYLQVATAHCVFDSMVTVSQQQLVKPGITFSAAPPVCVDKNGSLQVDIAGGLPPFSINLDNTSYSSNNIFPNISAGSHAIKIIDSNACLWDTAAIVQAYTLLKPDVHYAVKNPECFSSLPGTAMVLINGAESPYCFSLNQRLYNSGASVNNLLPGSYSIKIFNKAQCAVDSLMVSLIAQNNGVNCDTLFVPGAFTPNNDGLNDILKPIISNFPTNILFKVFNRFGENIFSTTKMGEGWNGMYKNIPQAADSYIWICSYVTTSGIKKFAKGVSVLIR